MGPLALIASGWKSITGRRASRADMVKANSASMLFGDDVVSDVKHLLSGVFVAGRPPKRGTAELLQAYSAAPWLRAVTHRIAHAVAGRPMKLYAVTGKGGPRKAFEYTEERDITARKAMKRALAKAGELRELPADYPMAAFLRAGNPVLSGRTCVFISQVIHDLKGDSYAAKARDGTGRPVRWYPLPPHWVISTPSVKLPCYRVQAISSAFELPPQDMFWWRDPAPLDPYGRGVGIGESLADDIDIDDYAKGYESAHYYNSAMPAGLVTVMGAKKAQLDELEQRWMDQHQGFQKAFRLHFTGAEIKFTPVAADHDEEKLIALREFERDAIMQTFGMPPEILGVNANSNRATIESADFLFNKHVVLPRLEEWRERWQGSAAEWDERIVVDFDSPVPADKEFTLSVLKVRPYAFTNNQALELAGMEPTDEAWGDERPPMPVDAPKETEVIPGGGGGGLLGGKAPRARTKAQEEQDDQQDRPDWDPDDIDDIVGAVDDQVMAGELAGIMANAVEDFGKTAFGSVAEGGDGAGAFSMSNPDVQSYLQDFAGDSIPDIGDTTRGYLQDFLASSYENGDSIDDITKALTEDDNFGFGDARAERIARTEVIGGSNFGTLQGYKQSGVVSQKTWLATPGTKGSRESHEDLDGATIGIDEDFTDTATGAKGQHPGGFGDPASDCNCRCAIAAAIEDHEEAAGRSRTKAAQLSTHAHHEAARAPHEKALRTAAAKVLDKQRAAVIRRLKKARR